MKLLDNKISSKSLCFLLCQLSVVDKNVKFKFHSYEKNKSFDFAIGEVRITNADFIELRKKESFIPYFYTDHDEWPSKEERRFLLCVVRLKGQYFSLYNSSEPQCSPLAMFSFMDMAICSTGSNDFISVLYELLPFQEMEGDAEYCTETQEISLSFELKDSSFIFN